MFLSLLALLAPPAHPADLALARPPLSCDSVGGLPRVQDADVRCMTFEAAGLSQPLVEELRGGDTNVLIGSRITFGIGGTLPVGDRTRVSTWLPMGVNTTAATEIDPGGFGDLHLGIRHDILRDGPHAVLIGAGLQLPTGRPTAAFGEPGLRPNFTLMGATGGERHRLTGRADLVVRRRDLETPGTFAGTIPGGVGVHAAASLSSEWTSRLRTHAGLVSRTSLLRASTIGQEPVEARLALTVHETDVTFGVYLGTAVLRGIGSTRWRGGLRVQALGHRRPDRQDPTADAPPAPRPRPTSVDPADRALGDALPDGPPDVDPPAEAPPAPSEPPPDELDPEGPMPSFLLVTLVFERGTTTLLPDSEGALDALLTTLRARPDLAPLLIEGHASKDGEHDFNYRLSLARADAVHRRLLDAGIRPERLVLRPVGEVAPRILDQAAQNRRVEVRLVLDPEFVDIEEHPVTGEPL